MTADRQAETEHLQPLRDRMARAIRRFHRSESKRFRRGYERLIDKIRAELTEAVLKADGVRDDA